MACLALGPQHPTVARCFPVYFESTPSLIALSLVPVLGVVDSFRSGLGLFRAWGVLSVINAYRGKCIWS